MHSAKRLFPFLAWPKPTPQLIKSEAFSGLSVGLMVIPQGVAYAALAGMPLITGIGSRLTGRLHMLDGRGMAWNEVRLQRNANCWVCGGHHGK